MPCFLRPAEPCVIVPAKKMPGHGRALPELRLGGQLRLAERRHAERGQVAERAGEPGRGDDLVGLDASSASRCRCARAWTSKRARRRRSDALGARRRGCRRRRRGRSPRTAGRSAPGRRRASCVSIEVFAGDGDESAIRLAHWSRPDASSKPGVLLADDEQALAGVGLGVARVGVVDGELDARRRRAVRLGDADREDRVAAAVLAVRGDEDEPVAVGASPRAASTPSGSRSGPGRRRARRRPQVVLHLRARREVRACRP